MRETLKVRCTKYKRNELAKGLSTLQLKLPWFEKMCPGCNTFIKGETMWTYVGYAYGSFGESGGNIRMWYCTDCFPKKKDIIHYLEVGHK